ncbi:MULTISPECIES: hypothetical protein [Brucella]|uniref:hypothetical protein n=1 Tax=Brucella TaxID=234 RepID=UPI0002D59E66|nr:MULTISPECIES: hypothetical protein [Brucella]APX70520.1 hypothetical protein BKD03_15290 [Brucella sp. 09RB8471]MRN79347.1 hypothetical protein [Brucella sp. 10RB9210]QGA56508.1 hypothetical protein GHC20_05145 [Brucella sp. 2280]
MKTALIAGLLALTPTLAFAETELADWQKAGLEKIKEEKKVRDAMWSQGISLWVGLDDDGTNRRGFGEYICLVLNQAGRPKGKFVSVSLLDHAAFMRGEHKELGKAVCQ